MCRDEDKQSVSPDQLSVFNSTDRMLLTLCLHDQSRRDVYIFDISFFGDRTECTEDAEMEGFMWIVVVN